MALRTYDRTSHAERRSKAARMGEYRPEDEPSIPTTPKVRPAVGQESRTPAAGNRNLTPQHDGNFLFSMRNKAGEQVGHSVEAKTVDEAARKYRAQEMKRLGISEEELRTKRGREKAANRHVSNMMGGFGKGKGNWGHKGRPGQRGGSA